MDDDFNTGGGIGVAVRPGPARSTSSPTTRSWKSPAKQTPDKLESLRRGATMLRELAATLGLFRKPQEEKAAGGDELADKLMKLLIDLRAEARKKKDFATADRIRNTLAEIGVVLEDRPAGPSGA